MSADRISGKERRWFLKSALAATTALTVETTLRPVGRLAQWVDSQFSLPEGNLAEKYAVFSRIIQDINLNPHNPLPRKQLKAWLLFNAACQYATINNFTVSARTAGHFLSASGQPLDITKEFFTSFSQFNLDKDSSWSKIKRSYFKWALFPQSLRSNKAPTANCFTPSGEALVSLLKSKSLKEIRYRGLTTSPNKDIAFGMGRSTLDFSAQVESISYQKGKAWHLRLTGTTYKISDLYDWDETKDLYVASSITPYWVIEKLLTIFNVRNPRRFLLYTIGKNNTEALSEPLVRVTFEDGAILQNSPYAKAFEIFTRKIAIEEPINITIPESVLN